MLTWFTADELLDIYEQLPNPSNELSSSQEVLLNGVETTFAAANQGCHVNDVEIIEVIKDGLGYGANGANGVIIIKTEK